MTILKAHLKLLVCFYQLDVFKFKIDFFWKYCIFIKSNKTLFSEKLFKCKVCDKKFSRKGNLNQHMKIHDESKAFKCDVCLKLFAAKSLLKLHYRTHTGEKPFACEICDRKFARKSDLVRHKATHRDDNLLVAVFVQKEDILKQKIV